MNARTLADHKSVAATHTSASERSLIHLRTPAPPNRSVHALRWRRIGQGALGTNARSGPGGGGRLPRVSASASPCPGLTPFGAPRRTDRKRHVRRCSNGLLRCTSTSRASGGQREQRGGGGDGGVAERICHLTAPNVTAPSLVPRSSNLPPPCVTPLCVSQLRRQAAPARGAGSLAGGGTKVPAPRSRKEPKKDGDAAPKGARWKQVAALVGSPAPPPPWSAMIEEEPPLAGGQGGWHACAGGGLLWRAPSECVSEPAATLSSPKDGFHTELLVPGATRPPNAAPDPPTAAPQAWYPLPQPPPLLTKSVQPLSCIPSAQRVASGSSSAAPHPTGALLAVAVGACSGGAVGSGAV